MICRTSLGIESIKETGSISKFEKDPLGQRYANDFADPYISENEKWWNWVYENKFKEVKDKNTLSTEFGSVTTGYSDSGSESLNKVFDVVYRKESFYFSNKSQPADPNMDKYIRNIYTYCVIPKLVFTKIEGKWFSLQWQH